jgi:hypothetical protein
MVPSHSKRSVPVLMPLNDTATSKSRGPMGASSNSRTLKDWGASKTMALAFMGDILTHLKISRSHVHLPAHA